LGGVLNSCYHNCLCPSQRPDPGAKLEIGQVTISIPLRVACPHLSTQIPARKCLCAYQQDCSQSMEAQWGYITSLCSSHCICSKAWTPASHLCNFLFHFLSAGWSSRCACYSYGTGSSDRCSVSSPRELLVEPAAHILWLIIKNHPGLYIA